MKYDVAAFVWPSYTPDEPRTRMFWPQGMGEWQSVISAKEKYPGDTWPRRPLWGYVNEADPRVMDMQIRTALDYGVNVFIYDWYWYDDRPFLENCLNDGFLKAPACKDMRFYLMWANHNANTLWDKRISDEGEQQIWSGAVTRTQFEKIGRRMIDRYFTQPNYYKINGCPVLMIYDLQNLLNGLGGAESTRLALDWLRAEVCRAGFPGLHLQLTKWGDIAFNVSGVDSALTADARQMLTALNFDSMTNYQFVHLADMETAYLTAFAKIRQLWRGFSQYPVPYFPHVSIGWDNNPRFTKIRHPILRDSCPENFRTALLEAKNYVDTHNLPAPLVTVNSWNEWTESSYLEPDDRFGYGYLQAIKDVFGGRDE